VELAELIAELQKHPAEEVTKLLPDAIRQPIYDSGHQAGLGQINEKVKRIEKERDTATQDRERLSNRVRELETNAPDVNKIRQQYEQQLSEVQAGHGEVVTKLQERLEKAEYGNAVSSLEAKLLARGLKPLYARVKSKDLRERLRYDENGELTVLQDGRDIPMAVAAGKDPLDALAEETYTKAEDDEKTVKMPKGPGVGPTPPKGSDTGDKYERIRSEVKKKYTPEEGRQQEKQRKLGLGVT
jgi:hypothetical protein